MAGQSAIIMRPAKGRIVFVRGQKVLLDHDLAELYGVTVKGLNQQIKRNRKRFPEDFMFQVSAEEHAALRSQIVTSKPGRGGRRYRPFAFTEHGAMMAASVLNSPQAIDMSLFIVRAFVRLREVLGAHKELAAKSRTLNGAWARMMPPLTRL
jgi:ORF6N domain